MRKLAVAFATILVLGSVPMAGAEDKAPSGSAMAGSIMVEDGFARATLPGAKAAGAYLTLMNHGTVADRLVSVSSPAATKVGVHEMVMKGEVMEMRPLADGLAVGAGETVRLAPGGLHLMFEGLKQPFARGSGVPVTLTFEKAGAVDLVLPVLAPGAKGPDKSASAGDDAMAGMAGMDHMQKP